MAQRSVTIGLKSTSSVDNGIVIPGTMARSLGLSGIPRINLGVGTLRRNVPVSVDEGLKEVLIGRGLAQELALPLPRRLKARFEPETNVLRFGPFIGIFVCRRSDAKSPRSRLLFGARTLEMRQLLRHARRLQACAFVITPECVDANKSFVSGYVISGKRWALRKFPVPDVVYDRIQSRSKERQEESEAAKSHLRSHSHLKYFNEGFFDKWELHQKMAHHPHIQQYLPETRELTTMHDLKIFVHRHGSIFVKPAEGSLGRGIIRIRRSRSGYEWRRDGRTHTTKRIDVMYQKIRRRGVREKYIMQPDLHLASFGGSPFDVRILMQKDGNGQWRRTKTFARVAARGNVTSNISRGGTGMGLGSVLRSRFPKSRKRILRRIRVAARSIVNGLDEVLEGPLGEVGLDLGVNRRGRIWLIEVNSKPYRRVNDAGPRLNTIRSFRRPMAYSIFLAGF